MYILHAGTEEKREENGINFVFNNAYEQVLYKTLLTKIRERLMGFCPKYYTYSNMYI